MTLLGDRHPEQLVAYNEPATVGRATAAGYRHGACPHDSPRFFHAFLYAFFAGPNFSRGLLEFSSAFRRRQSVQVGWAVKIPPSTA